MGPRAFPGDEPPEVGRDDTAASPLSRAAGCVLTDSTKNSLEDPDGRAGPSRGTGSGALPQVKAGARIISCEARQQTWHGKVGTQPLVTMCLGPEVVRFQGLLYKSHYLISTAVLWASRGSLKNSRRNGLGNVRFLMFLCFPACSFAHAVSTCVEPAVAVSRRRGR